MDRFNRALEQKLLKRLADLLDSCNKYLFDDGLTVRHLGKYLVKYPKALAALTSSAPLIMMFRLPWLNVVTQGLGDMEK